MIRKLFASALILVFLVGAQNIFAQEMSAKSDEAQKVEVMAFAEKAPSMVGQEVIIEGMVTHVCKHGGKKMFLMTEDPDVQVKITTGEKLAAFPVELEGSNVVVKGVVEEFMEEVEAESDEEQDDAHKNIYHKPQYSIAAVTYKVADK